MKDAPVFVALFVGSPDVTVGPAEPVVPAEPAELVGPVDESVVGVPAELAEVVGPVVGCSE